MSFEYLGKPKAYTVLLHLRSLHNAHAINVRYALATLVLEIISIHLNQLYSLYSCFCRIMQYVVLIPKSFVSFYLESDHSVQSAETTVVNTNASH